jgi:hypothetical protein
VQSKSKARGANMSPRVGIYYLADVMRLTNAKRSQVENWVRSGWLKPEGPMTTGGLQGIGHHRTFSFANLVDVAIGVRLSNAHIPFPKFFRDGSTNTLRGLVFPDYWSHIAGKTDAEIGELVTEGWTAEEWDDALAGSGLGRDEHVAMLIQRQRQDADASRAAWTAFKDPSTRPNDGLFILTVTIEQGIYTVYWQHDGPITVFDTALVINLGTIFEDLEDSTGDRWMAPSGAQET